MSDLKSKICRNIALGLEKDLLNNNDLVQIIEHTGGYLNIQTRADYAKSNNVSYNTAKKYRNNEIIFNVPFVIDNY